MTTYFNNQFLIAMPALADPNFAHTVTYICEHNDEGALGLVINRPSNLSLRDLLVHMDINLVNEHAGTLPVYSGGPVQPDRGFVLHEPLGEWEATLQVSEEIGVTASRDILTAIANGEGPRHTLITLGYAGWGAGQLEQEIVANAWLNGPAEQRIVFDTPVDERWKTAAAALGVDLDLLSNQAGHA